MASEERWYQEAFEQYPLETYRPKKSLENENPLETYRPKKSLDNENPLETYRPKKSLENEHRNNNKNENKFYTP